MPISEMSPRDVQRAAAVKTLFRLMAGGAGVGMFGRGLLHMMQPEGIPDVPFVSPGPSTLPIPVVANDADGKPPGLAKFAAELAKEAIFSDQQLANGFRTFAENFPLDVTGMTGWVGRNVSDPQYAPAMMPLSLGAAATGTVGGWSLADWMLKKRRRSHVDSQLQQAKDEFQAALMAQAQAARPSIKAAADESLGDRLDQLFDMLEKTAETQTKEANVADAASVPFGMYLTALGLLSGGSAYGMYNWTKNRSKAHLLDKALRERSRLIWQRAPQTVAAMPVAPTMPEEPAMAA